MLLQYDQQLESLYFIVLLPIYCGVTTQKSVDLTGPYVKPQ